MVTRNLSQSENKKVQQNQTQWVSKLGQNKKTQKHCHNGNYTTLLVGGVGKKKLGTEHRFFLTHLSKLLVLWDRAISFGKYDYWEDVNSITA